MWGLGPFFWLGWALASKGLRGFKICRFRHFCFCEGMVLTLCSKVYFLMWGLETFFWLGKGLVTEGMEMFKICKFRHFVFVG